ncbi:hypothetical protein [Mesorhizobium sophorae]|uniref:hypothetical protein n=1 Tax=Mesorhizobium sophorae TaxID=1300294 RepID=UPI00197CD909|nr:hypothetical protein [Mesorhizobium sophorae]
MARPKHVPDAFHRRQVEALAGYGVPEAEIAGMVGVDAKTLRKHYRQELAFGHTKANAKVAENLFRKATGEGRESVIAAIFWLKARGRWKETAVNEHSGLDGKPIEQVHEIRRIILSPPDWTEIKASRGVAPNDLGEEPEWSKWSPQ